MSRRCIREELHDPPAYDVGDILICTSDDRRAYHNQLFRCDGFSIVDSDDYTNAELLYSAGGNPKGHIMNWYTWRFEKLDGVKDCRLCTSSCKKEEVCAFFSLIGGGEIRNE